MIRTATLGYGVHGPESEVTEGAKLRGPTRELGETCETLVKCAVETRLPTPFGEFRLRAYEDEMDDLTHLALLMGGLEEKENMLVRVHSACLTGDALHSLRCDCGGQLEAAMERMAAEGKV
jgi:3,4-dihydroxy 2-butanone 4-phosphate synthase/GTP cyclohydrolase II